MIHNQRKYWIAIKANLFSDRAYSPSFSPPKATSIQWVKATTDEVITLPIAFSKIKFVVLGTCATSEWVYENVSVLNDSDLSTVTAWSASESQAGKIAKPKNIIAMGI